MHTRSQSRTHTSHLLLLPFLCNDLSLQCIAMHRSLWSMVHIVWLQFSCSFALACRWPPQSWPIVEVVPWYKCGGYASAICLQWYTTNNMIGKAQDVVEAWLVHMIIIIGRRPVVRHFSDFVTMVACPFCFSPFTKATKNFPLQICLLRTTALLLAFSYSPVAFAGVFFTVNIKILSVFCVRWIDIHIVASEIFSNCPIIRIPFSDKF